MSDTCECLKSIPEEYMPEFSYLNDFEQCYTSGMYHTAIKKIITGGF